MHAFSFGSSVSESVVQMPDGSMERRRTERLSDGTERTTVTKRTADSGEETVTTIRKPDGTVEQEGGIPPALDGPMNPNPFGNRCYLQVITLIN